MNALNGSDFPICFVLLNFIYGLAFFSMGLAMVLETRRDPLLASQRVLHPFATFFFFNGIYSWVEMWGMSVGWVGYETSNLMLWLRLFLLVISFSCLLIFGVRALHPLERNPRPFEKYFIGGLIGFYLFLFILIPVWQSDSTNEAIIRLTSVIRYSLGIPGALTAALALWRQSQGTVPLTNRQLEIYLKIVSVCFFLFAIRQFQVISNPVNIIDFSLGSFTGNHSGIYIQSAHTLLGIVMSLGLIRVSQLVEDERQRQFIAAREARVDALRRIENEMVEREAMRQELLRHIVLAQEDERARIARELHDETAQFLTVFSLNLATMQNILVENSKVNALLENLQKLSQSMSQGIHRMVNDLRPAQLDDLGLVAALQSLTDEQRRTGLNVEFETECQAQRLDSLIETVIFRIAQEALTNVSKHAQSQRATLQLRINPGTAVLRVRDYGVGFNISRQQYGNQGWGLVGMRERAESVGGFFKVYSAIGEGTLVEVIIPFKSAKDLEIRSCNHDECH